MITAKVIDSQFSRLQMPSRSNQYYSAEIGPTEDKLSKKTTVLEEIELDLFIGFEDTTALEDKKSLTVFSAIAVVGCTCRI